MGKQDVGCELRTERTSTLCGQMWRLVETWRYTIYTAYQPSNFAPVVTWGTDRLCWYNVVHPDLMPEGIYRVPILVSRGGLHTRSVPLQSFSLLDTSPPTGYHCCVIAGSSLGLRPAVPTDILRGFTQPPHRISRIPLPIRPRSLCSLDAVLRTADSVVK